MSRRTWFRWHQTLGLAAAAFLVVLAISGALLTFRGDLKAPPPVAPHVAEPLALEELAKIAVAAGDGAPATDIELALEPGQPYRVWLDDDDETEVYLDGRGKILEVRRGRQGLTRWLYRIHTGEVLGEAGEWVTVAVALMLLGLTATGLTMIGLRRRPRARKGRSGADAGE
jgi:uncharacterized iron-regulated membrane protein